MQSPVLHTRFSAAIWRHWYHLTDLVHLFTTFPHTLSKLLSQRQIFKATSSVPRWYSGGKGLYPGIYYGKLSATGWLTQYWMYVNSTNIKTKNKKPNKITGKAPQRKIAFPRQRGKLFLGAPFFPVRCSSFCRSPRGSEQKQSLKQRICWELGYIIAAGSSRLLRRMWLTYQRRCWMDSPRQTGCISSCSAKK